MIALITGVPIPLIPRARREQREKLQAPGNCQSFQVFKTLANERDGGEELEVDDVGVAQDGDKGIGTQTVHCATETEKENRLEHILEHKLEHNLELKLEQNLEQNLEHN